ncbi:MAG: glycoside hydrolase family 130 protein [Ilumatobacteraceae bacterium]
MAAPRVHDTGLSLQPDHRRVVTRLFVAGREDVGPGDSRAAPVIQRVLDLTEAEIDATIRDLDRRFSARHRAMHETYREHAELLIARIDGEAALMSASRRLVLGAAFTHEYAIEGAALCNPSAVPFPPPSPGGSASFVMSVRGVGEGHRSSIGFRTGAIDSSGTVRLDPPASFPVITNAEPSLHRRSVFHAKLDEHDDDRENASFVLDPMPELFDDSQLTERLDLLSADATTRRHTETTISNLRAVASSSYRSEFPFQTALSERVLWPQSPAERHGMEDARFVLFTEDDGSCTYFATYTAFDGINIAQHLLHTDDFRTFVVSPLAGAAAQGKGLALFPRRIDGRFVALSRSDRESNAIAYSDDMRCWPSSEQIQTPSKTWDLLQLGNCGSPIETDQGWLVLTHGVGPMRTYAIGVILLDLQHPERVIASSDEPILVPGTEHRDGYVPNVVYSCGGFVHGDTLVLPYGVADQHIRIATLSVRDVLASLRRH